MPATLPIESCNHLSYVARDLDASIAFYRDILGFRQIKRPNFEFSGAWLFNYGLQIHLIGKGPYADRGDDISIRTDHVAYKVADTDEIERLLQENGIPYKTNQVPNSDITQLFFQDPDGNHIEIGNYPSTFAYMNE